jgi:hypothetical protein
MYVAIRDMVVGETLAFKQGRSGVPYIVPRTKLILLGLLLRMDIFPPKLPSEQRAFANIVVTEIAKTYDEKISS